MPARSDEKGVRCTCSQRVITSASNEKYYFLVEFVWTFRRSNYVSRRVWCLFVAPAQNRVDIGPYSVYRWSHIWQHVSPKPEVSVQQASCSQSLEESTSCPARMRHLLSISRCARPTFVSRDRHGHERLGAQHNKTRHVCHVRNCSWQPHHTIAVRVVRLVPSRTSCSLGGIWEVNAPKIFPI